MSDSADTELVFYAESWRSTFTGAIIIAICLIALIYLLSLGDTRDAQENLLVFFAVIGLPAGAVGIVAARRRYPRLYLTPDTLVYVSMLGQPVIVDLATVGTAHITLFGRSGSFIRPPYYFLAFHGRDEELALMQAGQVSAPNLVDAKVRVPLVGLIGTNQALARQIADKVNSHRRTMSGTPLPQDRASRALSDVSFRRWLWIGIAIGIVIVGLVLAFAT